MFMKMETKFHRHVSSPDLIYRFCAIPITNQTDVRNKQEQNLKHNSEGNRKEAGSQMQITTRGYRWGAGSAGGLKRNKLAGIK